MGCVWMIRFGMGLRIDDGELDGVGVVSMDALGWV